MLVTGKNEAREVGSGEGAPAKAGVRQVQVRAGAFS
jgi:hypothetical protein